MTMTVQAVFENGVLRPVVPLSLPEGQPVQVVVDVGGSSDNRDPVLPEDSRKAEEMSEEEFEAALDELSAGLDDVPPLPASAISREGIYEGL